MLIHTSLLLRDLVVFLFLFFLVLQLPVGQGLLIHEVSRSHTNDDAPQSVGLLWTSVDLVAETST